MSAEEIKVEDGVRADYEALARFHYRAGAPGTCVRVLRAREDGVVVGVLVVSMPTLNGAWRAKAWPGWLAGLGPRERAREINMRLRVISRVIVEPRWRGLGVGRRLIRLYLESALTERTEAIAAMGACCPVFGAAGMREVAVTRSRRDETFARVLASAGVEAWELMEEARRREVLRSRVEIAEGVRSWGRSHRLVRDRVARGEEVALEQVCALAAAGLCATTRVYVHDSS
jgi:predicted GNAT family N-acyltransferase